MGEYIIGNIIIRTNMIIPYGFVLKEARGKIFHTWFLLIKSYHRLNALPS
jgi:hypothetical protein